MNEKTGEMEDNEEELYYLIALTLVEKIGAVTARRLVQYCGSAKAVFEMKYQQLRKIPGIGHVLSKNILQPGARNKAEEELKFVRENKVNLFAITDEAYPARLKHCPDAPLILYTKGSIDFNRDKVVSIVGTRNATREGKEFVRDFVRELAVHNVTVVSGLAYGIDIAAHQAAYENNLQTFAVLAHGLDTLYPSLHKRKARLYQENGGIVSDFPSGTKPDRERFPSRNRIVAGISDATIVVESKRAGGSIITAELAESYHRDVFAVPGWPGNEKSEGCNYLIKSNRAYLLESVSDLEYQMGWGMTASAPGFQNKLCLDLSEEESRIMDVLNKGDTYPIDELAEQLGMVISKLSVELLNLELNGWVESIPGKRYKCKR